MRARILPALAFTALLATAFTVFQTTAFTASQTEAPSPPPPSTMMSHDTPIIVQGGSLSVWTADVPRYVSKRNLIIALGSPLKYVLLDDDENLSHIDQARPAVVLPANDSWELCSGAPQNLEYLQNGSNLTISSWDLAHPDGGFTAEPTGTGKYTHGYRHSETQGFGGLYFGASGQACSTVIANATPSCSGTPEASCQIVPPSRERLSKKIYIVFSTK